MRRAFQIAKSCMPPAWCRSKSMRRQQKCASVRPWMNRTITFCLFGRAYCRCRRCLSSPFRMNCNRKILCCLNILRSIQENKINDVKARLRTSHSHKIFFSTRRVNLTLYCDLYLSEMEEYHNCCMLNYCRHAGYNFYCSFGGSHGLDEESYCVSFYCYRHLVWNDIAYGRGVAGICKKQITI